MIEKNRNIYLKMLSLEKTKKLILNYFNKDIIKEILKPYESLNRILYEPIFAKISSPHFNAAAMDGIAVNAKNTFGTSDKNPQKLVLGKEAILINTGQKIPETMNAVIMVEDVQFINDNECKIEKAAFPWQNIRKVGEDIISSELLYTRYHEITSYCIGAMISSGILDVPVIKKVKILVIPTGTELIDCDNASLNKLKPGKILESNSYVIEKMIENCGGICVRSKAVIDDFNFIKNSILKGIKSDFDMVITIGGSSAGSKDYLLKILESIGKVLVHGVSIMPGKPIVIGDIDSKPFFGLPGYPVSAIIAFEQFVQPLIRKFMCVGDFYREKIFSILSNNVVSKFGIEEFLRVKLGIVKKKIIAYPLPRSSGKIRSLTDADGIIRIPEKIEGFNYKDKVETELINTKLSIKNNIIVIGSHDNSIDIVADKLKLVNNKFNLSSTHVGSIGGIMAIRKGIAHVAGIHLLDEETGEYNVSYIKKYLSGCNVKLVNLVMRQQGIMIFKGNPKGIESISDLTRNGVNFINRQKGSGTRILLDYKLKCSKISPDNISGYDREEFTHMDIAATIANKTADVGIGIYAAAKLFNLDFLPILIERYDLLFDEEIFYSGKINALMKVINSKMFKDEVELLGGYSTINTGKIII